MDSVRHSMNAKKRGVLRRLVIYRIKSKPGLKSSLLQAKAKTCHRELANAKAARDTLQEEANEEMPVGLQGLEEAKRVGFLLFFTLVLSLTPLFRKRSKNKSPSRNNSPTWFAAKRKLTTLKNRCKTNLMTSRRKFLILTKNEASLR